MSDKLHNIKNIETLNTQIRDRDNIFKNIEAPNTLIIECDNIYLHQKYIDLTIEIPTEKIGQFDYLSINGIKFKMDKGE